MTYTAGTPNAADPINQTQQKIKDNFGDIKTSIEQDHGAFGAATQGKHTGIHLVQGSAPATAATEWGLYCKTDGTAPQIYLKQPNNGAEILLTESGGVTPQVLTVPPLPVGDLKEGNGESYLPGGFGIKWGRISNTSAATPYTYAAMGLTPFATNTYNVVITNTNASFGFKWSAWSPTAAGFLASRTLDGVAGPINAFWVAIGQ